MLKNFLKRKVKKTKILSDFTWTPSCFPQCYDAKWVSVFLGNKNQLLHGVRSIHRGCRLEWRFKTTESAQFPECWCDSKTQTNFILRRRHMTGLFRRTDKPVSWLWLQTTPPELGKTGENIAKQRPKPTLNSSDIYAGVDPEQHWCDKQLLSKRLSHSPCPPQREGRRLETY